MKKKGWGVLLPGLKRQCDYGQSKVDETRPEVPETKLGLEICISLSEFLDFKILSHLFSI